MRNSCVRPLAFAVLLLLAAAPLAAAPQETPAPSQVMRYDIRFMDLHAAEVLAWDRCIKKERCRIGTLAVDGDASRRGYLEVTADAETQERIARALAKADAVPRTQSFQILLLAASASGGGSAPDVPANARKALGELQGFLPFKSYQLLDTVWLRTTQDRTVQGQIAGHGGTQYQLRLRFRNVGSPEDRTLFIDTFWLRNDPIPPSPPPAENGKEAVAAAPKPIRDLIQTSFGLKEGETIVVGTSKIDGSDAALVVLLTAVPSP